MTMMKKMLLIETSKLRNRVNGMKMIFTSVAVPVLVLDLLRRELKLLSAINLICANCNRSQTFKSTEISFRCFAGVQKSIVLSYHPGWEHME